MLIVNKTKKVLIDTNIWLYYLDETSEYHKKARNTISLYIKEGYDLFITCQIIREILVVMTKFNPAKEPVSIKNSVLKIREILKFVALLFETKSTQTIFEELIIKHNIRGLKIHDANIISIAMENSINKIITNNPEDFENIGNIEIITL